MTQEIDIAALRKAAEEATPGPWVLDAQGSSNCVYDGEMESPLLTIDGLWAPLLGLGQSYANLAHAAAANPAVILALLDRLEQVEKDAARWRYGAQHGFPIRWTQSADLGGRIFWTHTHGSQEEYPTAADVVDAAMQLAAMQGEGA